MIIKTDTELISPYFSDASYLKGKAEIVYFPENFNDLHEAVLQCYQRKLPITLSGARTGLTGGASPIEGSLISTEKLNKIISIDTENKTAIVQPGVLWEQFSDKLYELGFFFPPNPTEKGGSLGGNVATNASGARTFKYGATRKFVKKLKIVLVNGEILELNRGENFAQGNKLEIQTQSGTKYNIVLPEINMPQIKHAAGYFIKQDMDALDLFIGSEGTLGVTAEIELAFQKLPEKVIGGLIFFHDEAALIEFVKELRDVSNINNAIPYTEMQDISARIIEYFDKYSLNLLSKYYSQIPDNSQGAIWFEQEYPIRFEDIILTKWNELINKHTKLADDTWIAINENEHRKLREFRHKLPLEINEVLAKSGQEKFATDTAVPDDKLEELFYFITNGFDTLDAPTLTFGHIGNNHFHANLLMDSDDDYPKVLNAYENLVSFSLGLGGTVSAEHGIGKIKKKYLLEMFGIETVNKMRQIKLQFDPDNLLGRGTLF